MLSGIIKLSIAQNATKPPILVKSKKGYPCSTKERQDPEGGGNSPWVAPGHESKTSLKFCILHLQSPFPWTSPGAISSPKNAISFLEGKYG